MDIMWIVLIAVVVLALVGLVVFLAKRRGASLERKFGPEYERTVSRTGDRERAEAELQQRVERRETFDIRDLDAEERTRFTERWRAIQRDFVDEPEHAVRRADELIQDVMRTRGYPVEDFEQRAADLSVDHPAVVQHYRAGRHILDTTERVPTERLREALVSFRALFEQLVGVDSAANGTPEAATKEGKR
jgi:hypothetical protein